MAPLFTGLRLSFGRSAEVAGPTSFATGGNVNEGITPGNGYRYYAFISPGNFIIANGSKPFDILVVAGGGGGGGAPPGNGSGGGGAGGISFLPNITLGSGTYPVIVGTGGPTGIFPGSHGSNGEDSSFASSPNPYYILSKGGGGGETQGAPSGPSMAPGGSGGGGITYRTGPPNATQPSQNSHNPNIGM